MVFLYLNLRTLLRALPNQSHMICKTVVFVDVISWGVVSMEVISMGRLLPSFLSVISAMCSQYCW